MRVSVFLLCLCVSLVCVSVSGSASSVVSRLAVRAEPTTGFMPGASRQYLLRGGGWGVPASTPWKIVLHTTEGGSVAGAVSAYGGRNQPHFTVTFEKGRYEAYQHISIDRSAMALRHPAGTPHTNMANAIQIEIVGRAAQAGSFPTAYLQGIKSTIDWIRAQKRIPNVIAPFMAYPASGRTDAGIRFTGAEFLAFGGVCGHQHVPFNSHGDPGAINIGFLMPNAVVRGPAPPSCSSGGRRGSCIARAACTGANTVVPNLCRGVPVCCMAPRAVGSNGVAVAEPAFEMTAEDSAFWPLTDVNEPPTPETEENPDFNEAEDLTEAASAEEAERGPILAAEAAAASAAPVAPTPDAPAAPAPAAPEAAAAAAAAPSAAAPAVPEGVTDTVTPPEAEVPPFDLSELNEEPVSDAAPTDLTQTLVGSAGRTYTYSQSSGRFTFTDGSTTTCYSGRVAGTINNPARQNIKSPCQGSSPACMTSPAGPIPQGRYTLSSRGPASFGPNSYRLTPAASNNMFGRGSFLIHAASATKDAGGQRRSSAGCIIMPPAGRAKLRQGVTLIVTA